VVNVTEVLSGRKYKALGGVASTRSHR
jgi:hypothetical protein